MFTSKFRKLARMVVLAALLAADASVASAQRSGPVAPHGAVNLATYGSCALGLGSAGSFSQAWAALLVCARIIADEWNRMY